MAIFDILSKYKLLPLASISKESISVVGNLIHEEPNSVFNYLEDETGKLWIYPLDAGLMDQVKMLPERTILKVFGKIERTEFDIVGMRVEDLEILS